MKKLIILNHKMSLEYDEIIEYIQKINTVKTTNNLIICPSNIYLESFINHCHWPIASQNVSSQITGNYTGEISPLQLKSLGVEYTLIGHYERKKYFHETNEIINQKLLATLDNNLIPILCFGETGKQDDLIANLNELLKGVPNIDFIIFAYEPLQISKKLTKEQITDDINLIYNYLYKKYQSRPNIVYGGGLAKEDINKIFKIEKLNGILIGKISSNINKITKIITNIQ